MPPSDLHLSASRYCELWIGTFYKWGGDDPSGFDCSGIIHEVLQAFGYEKRGFDCKAHDLYLRFKDNKVEDNYFEGCLVFWFVDGKAIHVEMITEKVFIENGKSLVITTGASGGGSKTTSKENAILHNAYIKKNVIDYRGLNFKVVDPFKKKEA